MIMVDIILEVLVNLVQACMFIGFLYFFFEPSRSKAVNIIGLCCAVLTQFAAVNFFTFHTDYIPFSDTVVYIILMEIYTLLFLEGNLWIRLVLPPIDLLINSVISFFFGYIVSITTGESFSNLVYESSLYRYFCMAIISLTNLLVLWLIIRLTKKKINLMKWTDVSAFIIIPIIAMIIINCTFLIITKTHFQSDIIGYLAIICAGMIAVVITIMYMMVSVSRKYEIQTKLLLSEQREKLYEEDILKTNTQIEKISKIKHDMKNNLMCIDRLISDDNLAEAQSLCNDVLTNLTGVYTPLNTENPLLNAIVNVELEKAVSSGIEFTLNISDSLKEMSDTHDIISLIGNLCDNAIEYLSSKPKEMRQMSLEISTHNKYHIIICKNKIQNSVLTENPSLKSSKQDLEFHGKGMEIIKSIAKKYNGGTKMYEENNYFCLSVIIKG